MLFALKAEEWIAIATLVGPVFAAALAIMVGANRYRAEQELRDVRRYLLEDGALRLKAGLDALLEATRRNYTISYHLIRYIRDIPNDHPARPRPEDLPALVPTDTMQFAFEAIAPASRLMKCLELGDVATSAFGALYNANLVFHTQVAQTVRSYYGAAEDWQGVDFSRDEWCATISEVVERYWRRAERYADLSRWLGDAALRAQELRIRRFDDLERVNRDPLMVRLAQNVAGLSEQPAGARAI